MTMTQPIRRQSLHVELVDRLRDLLVQGQFEPGSKVPEAALCESFQVSRTPMREALKVLASEGLVRLEPNRGAWVAEIDIADLEAAFPVLAALEALAGELAVPRISDQQIAEIRVHHTEMVAQFESGNRAAYFQENQKIHRIIMAAADNPVLARHHRRLEARLRVGRFHANSDPDRWAEAIAEHDEILTALEARDAAALPFLLRTHIENKFASLKRAAQVS